MRPAHSSSFWSFIVLLVAFPYATPERLCAAPVHSVVVLKPESVVVSRDANGHAAFACRNVQWLNSAGEPNVPWQVLTVLLPPDASLATVSTRLLEAKWEPVAGTWIVRPSPPATTADPTRQIAVDGADDPLPPEDAVAARDPAGRIVAWPRNKRIVNGRDIDIYEQDSVYPGVDARLETTGRLRKWRLAQVAVPLVRYKPISGALERLTAGALVISFERTGSTAATATKQVELLDSVGEDTVRRIAVNFEQDSRAYEQAAAEARGSVAASALDTAPRYAIVTTSAIVAASTELQNFVAHKQSLGFNVSVVTEADFGGGIGDVAAENIRAWLQQHYVTDNILYVLFVGNPHPGQGDVPMKMLYPRNNEPDAYKESPSDYYYADLTGNWDLDGDGYYGEWSQDFGAGGVDRFWDVLVGRIPCYPESDTGLALYDSGPPRRVIYNGQTNYVGFLSGNVGTGLEQRWSAHPFTLPPGTWRTTHIDVDYYISTGGDFDRLRYIVWSRIGQERPEPGDELAQGVVTAPLAREDTRIPTANNYLHQIPVDFQLQGGDYYLTIYAERSGGQAGGSANWLGNTEFGIPLLYPDPNPNPGVDAFFWRSAQFPSPGFQTYNLPASTWAPSPGQDPNQLYTASMTIYGNAAASASDAKTEMREASTFCAVADVDHILAKTIAYENTLQSQSTWRRNVLLPMKADNAAVSDAFLYAYRLGEEIKEAVIVPSFGWSYHRVYDESYSLNPPPETIPCTADNVTSVWSSEPFGAVIWGTHGSETRALDVFDVTRVGALNDAYPAFTFQASCLNSHPETANNLAFSLLKTGAVGTVGATRVAWAGVKQADFAGTATAGGMAADYARRLIGNGLNMGESLYDIKQALALNNSMYWMNQTDFNAYGCPALGLNSYRADGMTVSPGIGVSAVGDAGGPFIPNAAVYGVKNNFTSSIDYRVAKTAPWVSLNGGDGPLTGTLAPGQSVNVAVSINPQAQSLVAGRYTDTVAFSNLTTGIGDAVRSASLRANPLYGGTTIQPTVHSVATDSAGNIYVISYVYPPGAFHLSRFAPDGHELWTKTVAGSVSDIAADRPGNVYVLGTFGGTVPIDFDPTPGEDWHLAHTSSSDIFVTSLRSDGSYAWTNTAGGDYSRKYANAVACDRMGNVFVTGSFWGTVDFDPSAEQDWRSAVGSNENLHDIFVTTYAGDGAYRWTRTFGGGGNDWGSGVATDVTGGVVISGSFEGDVDFDPSSGIDVRSSAGSTDAFATKLRVDGSYAWTRTFGGSGLEYGKAVAADHDGNVFLAGTFDDYGQSVPYVVDFDPSTGVDLQVCRGGDDSFLTKLDQEGGYLWTRTMGSFGKVVGPFGGSGQDEYVEAITLDGAGNPVIVGWIGCEQGSWGPCIEVDCDPTAGTDWYIGRGRKDVFVIRMDKNGGYAWAGLLGGADQDEVADVAVDRTGNVLVVGQFGHLLAGGPGGSADLDPTVGEDWYTSTNDLDGFITKLARAAVAVTLGDFDHDGDVDEADFDRFALCFTGPGAGPIASGCEPGDFDGDDDIDCDDWNGFKAAWSGSGSPPEFQTCPASETIPTVSAWGMVTISLLTLTAGTVILTRQGRARSYVDVP